MIAFQKYCKVHQGRLMGFTIFMGIAALVCILAIIAALYTGKYQKFADQIFSIQLIGFPLSFFILLLVHKIFKLYQQGFFFTQATLKVYRAIAQLAIYYALVIKPGYFLVIELTKGETLNMFFLTYLTAADFMLAIVAYALNLVAGITKLSRDIEQENELTI